MKLLLSNDDGYDAPGLAALVEAAQPLGELAVVAPAEPQSCMSHAVTMGVGMRSREYGQGNLALYGTPADCIRVGLLRVAPQAKWVLSGINHGGNLGVDIYYSGTVAAVREAVLHGWPGIAVSHFRKGGLEYDWARVVPWVRTVLQDLMARPVSPGLFYNVNLPHLAPGEPDPQVVFCPLDQHPLPLSFRPDEEGRLFYDGNYHSRQRQIGADVDVCFSGNIAVTEVHLF